MTVVLSLGQGGQAVTNGNFVGSSWPKLGKWLIIFPIRTNYFCGHSFVLKDVVRISFGPLVCFLEIGRRLSTDMGWKLMRFEGLDYSN